MRFTSPWRVEEALKIPDIPNSTAFGKSPRLVGAPAREKSGLDTHDGQ